MDQQLVSQEQCTQLEDSLLQRSYLNYQEEPDLEKSSISSNLTSNRKAAAEAKLEEAWNSSTFAKKIADRAKRASLNDLDRFKCMIARKQRNFKLRHLASGKP